MVRESSGWPACRRREALEAILSVMPLDTYVDAPARMMQVVGDADAVPEIVAEFQPSSTARADNPCETTGVERHAFYVEARKAYCIVQTAEARLYGNIILSQGRRAARLSVAKGGTACGFDRRGPEGRQWRRPRRSSMPARTRSTRCWTASCWRMATC